MLYKLINFLSQHVYNKDIDESFRDKGELPREPGRDFFDDISRPH